MVAASVRVFRRGGTILCFHSIITPDLPAEGEAHVSAGAFSALVRVARRVAEIVPLRELVTRHTRAQPTSGLTALTFDDAYAALHSTLKDLISREGVPVTIFSVTDAATTGASYWWDRIEDLFPRLSADRWRAFEMACGVPEEYRRGQPREYGPLRPFRQWLLAAYAGRWPLRFDSELASLEAEVGHRTLHRSMTFDELAELAAMPEVELGVHTVSHPVLPLLPDVDLRQEIVTGYDALRERFANVLPVLAVPFGLYDERTLRVAHRAGMMASLTLAGRLVSGSNGECALPRCCITRSDTRVRLALRLLGVPDLVRAWSGCRPAPYPDLPSPTS